MKTIFLTIGIALLAFSTHAQESLKGVWNTGEDNTLIEIIEEDGAYAGKVTASDKTEAKIGAKILQDVALYKGEWKGKLYSAKKSKWFDVILNEEDNTLFLKVKAGLATKTVEWTREMGGE